MNRVTFLSFINFLLDLSYTSQRFQPEEVEKENEDVPTHAPSKGRNNGVDYESKFAVRPDAAHDRCVPTSFHILLSSFGRGGQALAGVFQRG